MPTVKDLWDALTHLVREVPSAFPRFLRLLLLRLRECWHRRTGPDPATCCLPIPAGVWLQPDAYLYSQRYLMSLGMAVTWDNPDVTLTDMGGAVIGSHDLLPSTDYRVTATIHNRSAAAPAPGLPVVFTLIAFGAGGPSRQTIGVATIDLPVRAAPGEPAPASVVWRTPPTPDHYCIEIDAAWPDDAFPPDNVGQHNTVVRRAAPGQRLELHVPVYLPSMLRTRSQAMLMRIRLDTYTLPPHPQLRDERESREALKKRVIDANRPERFAPDLQWNAALSADELVLESDAIGGVDFTATVPGSARPGSEQRFNVSVSDAKTGAAVGGVTVIVQVT